MEQKSKVHGHTSGTRVTRAGAAVPLLVVLVILALVLVLVILLVTVLARALAALALALALALADVVLDKVMNRNHFRRRGTAVLGLCAFKTSKRNPTTYLSLKP